MSKKVSQLRESKNANLVISDYAEDKIKSKIMRTLIKVPQIKKIYARNAKQEICKIQLEAGGYPVPILSDNCKHLKRVINTLNTYLSEEIKRGSASKVKIFKRVNNLPYNTKQVLLKNNTMETPETVLKNCLGKKEKICEEYSQDTVNRKCQEKSLQDLTTIKF
jgi:hypothetical protein